MSGNPKQPAPPMKKITLNHGGRTIEVPELSEPVGNPTASLLAKYPRLNQPEDLAIVDFYLARIEALRDFKHGPETADSDTDRLLRAFAAVKSWTNRSAAIASLQRSFNVMDAEEVDNCLVRSRGRTLIELVDNGDIAEKLLSRSVSGKDPHRYIYRQPFDRQRFQAEYFRFFSRFPKFSARSSAQLSQFLGFMEADPAITDIRWMAYMLGTALVESSKVIRVTDPRTRKTTKVWSNFAPTEETGHGRGMDYFLPVKVKRLPDGSARVAEQDGDQFTVSRAAVIRRDRSRAAKHGAPYGGVTSALYAADDGIPLQYFGRGYVQLTWWDNYASAGALLGRGLDFLFAPDLVMDAKTAYKLMSYCMRTGSGFANRRRFSQYFFGTFTDYEAARDMVNARGDHHEVAHAAELFEKALIAAVPGLPPRVAKKLGHR